MRFLKAASVLLSAWYATGCTVTFPQGVASGDPLHDRVIIWTRALPVGCGELSSLTVDYVMGDIEGSVIVDETTDWTVKVDVAGLNSLTTYTPTQKFKHLICLRTYLRRF